MFDNDLERYNEYIEIYFDKYKALLDAQDRKLGKKIDPINLILATYDHHVLFGNDESAYMTRKSDEENLQIFLTWYHKNVMNKK